MADQSPRTSPRNSPRKGAAAANDKRKPRAKWTDDMLTDLVDIILSDEALRDVLMAAKPKPNQMAYKAIYVKFKERYPESSICLDQLRTKFKNTLQEVKSTLKTVKTATGIAEFIESKGYGAWFNRLAEVLGAKAGNRPETVLEPGTGGTAGEEVVTPPETKRRRRGAAADLDQLGDMLKESVESTKRMESSMLTFTGALTAFMGPMAAAFQQQTNQQHHQQHHQAPNHYPPQQQTNQQHHQQHHQAPNHYPPQQPAHYYPRGANLYQYQSNPIRPPQPPHRGGPRAHAPATYMPMSWDQDVEDAIEKSYTDLN